MRFHLPIVKCTHPSEARIRHVVVPSHCPGTVLAAVQGKLYLSVRAQGALWHAIFFEFHKNLICKSWRTIYLPCIVYTIPGNNEVGLWNLESKYRQTVLWASPSPILSTTHSSPHSVSAVHAIQTVGAHGHLSTNVLTVGTDMRLRFWDLQRPSDSKIISCSATERIDQSLVSYRLVTISGIREKGCLKIYLQKYRIRYIYLMFDLIHFTLKFAVKNWWMEQKL